MSIWYMSLVCPEQGGNIELATLLRVLNHLGVTLGEFFKGFD